MTEPIRILHVIAARPHGGTETAFLNTVLALSDAGVTQQIVARTASPARERAFADRHIGITLATFDRLIRWPTNNTIVRLNNNFRPHIVQYWLARAASFALRADDQSLPVNVGWHGGFHKIKNFARCNYHIALTDDIHQHLVDHGVGAQTITRIDGFADLSKDRIDRSTLETPEDAPVLLTLARLHWTKGLDVALESMAFLPQAYLWIAGEGPVVGELKTLAAEMGLESRIRYLGWREDYNAVINAADICLVPSRQEIGTSVAIDAWAAGKPLIVAEPAVSAVHIAHEQNALVVTADDVDGLANAVKRVLADPALAAKLVAGGNATYASAYTPAIFKRRALDFYTRIMGNAERTTA